MKRQLTPTLFGIFLLFSINLSAQEPLEILQRINSPHVNVCSEKIRETYPRHDPSHPFSQLLHVFAEDPCAKNDSAENKKKLIDLVLPIINRAIDEHNFLLVAPLKPLSPLKRSDFAELNEAALMEVFQQLMESLIHKDGHPPDAEELMYRTKLNLNVDKSIQAGLIPLPIHPSWEDVNLYNFDSIFQLIRLGVVPLEVDRDPPEIRALGNEHPLNPLLTSNTSSLLYHDGLHLELITDIYTNLHLGDPVRCRAFQACFQSIPGMGIREGTGPKKAFTRMAGSYVLHEDLELLSQLAQGKNKKGFYRDYYDQALLDFALELAMSSKKYPQFSLKSLLGMDNLSVARERCAIILDQNPSTRKKVLKTLESMVGFEDLENNILGEVYINDRVLYTVTKNFLQKFEMACRADPRLQSSGMSASHRDLDFGVDLDVFRQNFRTKITELAGEIKKIKAHLQNPANADCVLLFSEWRKDH